MPVPIMPIPDKNRDDKQSMDYSFLFTAPVSNKKTVTASNKDASLLFDLWSKGERGETPDTIKINASLINDRDIIRLKNMGFLEKDANDIKFTKKGKIVITTMSLGEDSQFDKKRKEKSYTEILASMDKRNKNGFRIPRMASDNSLDLRKF